MDIETRDALRKKKIRRLKNVQVDSVDLVDVPAVKRFALYKRDGRPTSMQEFFTGATDHDKAVLETGFESQDAEVQDEILKRLTALNMKVDLLTEIKVIEGAFLDLRKRNPGQYLDCLRNPENYVVIKNKDGSLSIIQNASVEAPVSADGQREHVIDDSGRAVWRPRKKGAK